MRAATLFSGIGAPECAAPWLDWRWSAEIDAFAVAVHAARFPGMPNLGDVNRIDPDAVEPVDLVVFGSPCQSFSVAGKRLGLDDPRGNLALVALRLVERLRPRWFVFENVPGLLSSDGGRDFGAFLGTVEQCGYGWAYRTLDAQFAGVPQRRRRVFVVGCLGDWRGPAAVLFEPESLRGNTAPRREAGQRIARPVAGCLEGGSGYRNDADTADNLIAFDTTQITSPLYRGGGLPGRPCHTLAKGSHPPAIAFSAKDHGGDAGETAPTLRAGQHHKSHANAGVMPAVAFQANAGRIDGESETFVALTLAANSGRCQVEQNYVAHSFRADGADGFDASEDGTGRGTPLVTHALTAPTGRGTVTEDGTGRGTPLVAVGRNGELAATLQGSVGGNGNAGNGSEAIVAVATPLTLAIRGRGDSHDLEYRDDGIANAILTPNGGRAGIGVGAVAIHENQPIPLQCNGGDVGFNLPSLRAGNQHITGGGPAVAFTASEQANGYAWERDHYPALDAQIPNDSSNLQKGIRQGMSVRRLTPRECERLQGFPDDFTAITYRGKPAADGPRYRALGNSMAVPVIGWVLDRIREFAA